MKQENFLFVDIISSIFLLILLFANFLGLMYITDANFIISLLISLFIVICYYFSLQVLKRNKERMANKGYKDVGMLVLLVFVLFGGFSFVCILHLFNIESNVKMVLHKEATATVDRVKDAAYSYDTLSNDALQSFEAKFKSKLQAYKNTRSNTLRNELTNEPFKLPESILNSPSSSIDVVASTNAILQAHRLKVDQNKKIIDSVYVGNIKENATAILNWDRLNISQSYMVLSKHTQEAQKAINDKIKELPIEKQELQIETTNTALPLNNPIQLAALYKPDYIIPAVAVIIMNLFILIPFFTHKVRVYNNRNNHKGDTNGNSTNTGAIEL